MIVVVVVVQSSLNPANSSSQLGEHTYWRVGSCSQDQRIRYTAAGLRLHCPGGFEGLWRVSKSSSGEWLSAGRNKEPI